jgi:MFS family permease
MGLSMEMKEHNFSAGEVSTANAVGGLVTIPIILLVGALSDRFGRKYFLMLGYLVALGSTVMLFFARDLGQFWVASSLVLASRSMISSMSPAYATDLVRRRFLGKALPLVGTMTWVSGVAGFAGAGYILDTFGAASLYGITAVAASVAFLIVAFLPRSLRRQAELPAPGKETSLQPTGD